MSAGALHSCAISDNVDGIGRVVQHIRVNAQIIQGIREHLDELGAKSITVTIIWVKGHSKGQPGSFGNQAAHELATQALRRARALDKERCMKIMSVVESLHTEDNSISDGDGAGPSELPSSSQVDGAYKSVERWCNVPQLFSPTVSPDYSDKQQILKSLDETIASLIAVRSSIEHSM
jgi:hypothetical protein